MRVLLLLLLLLLPVWAQTDAPPGEEPPEDAGTPAPAVIGLRVEDARSRWPAVPAIEYVTSQGPSGRVIYQDPISGAALAPGYGGKLFVSKPPERPVEPAPPREAPRSPLWGWLLWGVGFLGAEVCLLGAWVWCLQRLGERSSGADGFESWRLRPKK